VFRVSRLDDSTVESAGALVAREQVAARRVCPQLPASFASAEVSATSLQRLRDGGHSGVVAVEDGRVRAVMTGIERVSRAGSRYVELPAAGFAIDPDLEDPTRLLAVVYGEFADAIVADGVLRHYLGHVALPALSEAVTNVGFGRSSIFAVRPAVPGTESSDVQVRIAGLDDLDAIARLSLVELRHRSTSPIFSVGDSRSHEQRGAEHRALVDRGAQHLIATLDGQDVGLLTIELSSPAPRLCPDGEPYIGPTATLPAARRRSCAGQCGTALGAPTRPPMGFCGLRSG